MLARALYKKLCPPCFMSDRSIDQSDQGRARYCPTRETLRRDLDCHAGFTVASTHFIFTKSKNENQTRPTQNVFPKQATSFRREQHNKPPKPQTRSATLITQHIILSRRHLLLYSNYVSLLRLPRNTNYPSLPHPIFKSLRGRLHERLLPLLQLLS